MMPFAPHYALATDTPAPLVFQFVGETLLLGPDRLLAGDQLSQHLGPPRQRLSIGTLGDQPCALYQWDSAADIPEGFVKGHYRQLWGHWSQSHLDALARAQGLATWLNQNRYCGICAQPLETSPQEPARSCPACGFKAYPRISPVCIGLVRRGDSLLLARSPHFPPGIFSALAGYLEVGESVEACLRREIREESGIEITRIRWFGSQVWPYPNSLMMGFFADYAGGELCPQAGEIEALDWFPLNQLPLLPHPSTIAAQMIEAVRRGEAPRSDGDGPIAH